MQSVSSRIWTRVAVSISYDDNHFTTGISIKDIMIYMDDESMGVFTKELLRCKTEQILKVKWSGHDNKLATVIESDPKAPFSIATTPWCRGGCYSITEIAPLYSWALPYNAEC